MVLTPRPKRRQPTGCMVMALALPLPFAATVALSDLGAAPLAFDLIEVAYWLAVMAGTVCGIMGNRVAWALVGGAYVSAGLDWQGVAFDPLRWIVLDLAMIAAFVALSIGRRLSAGEWAILALFPVAWLLYLAPDPFRYLGVAALCIVQLGLTVPRALALAAARQERATARR